MNNEIVKVIKKIEAKGLSRIELLALVSETSYEIVFYAKYQGEMRQSNDLAESGIISLGFVDAIYEEVAEIIKMSKMYNYTKMNILKVSDEKISVDYEERDCKLYSLKKKWKEEIGVNF